MGGLCSLVLDDAEGRVVQQVEAHAGTDVLVVLVPPLKVVHVGRQVRVDEAEAGVVEHEAHGHTTLVTLHTEERCITVSVIVFTCLSVFQSASAALKATAKSNTSNKVQ